MSPHIYRFVWLDDSPTSIDGSLQRAIKETGFLDGESTQLDVVGLDGKEVVGSLNQLLAKAKPDLVILDHFLSKAAGTVFRKGSTVAAEIRDHWHDVPIVGVTGAINTWNDRLSHLAIAEYLEIFERDRVAQNIWSLHVLAHGFRQIAALDTPVSERIFRLVDASATDVPALLTSLPTDLKKRSDPGTAHALARWIYHELIGRPGFVYDRLHAATLVGLTEAGFSKVEDVFDDAMYRGVFCSPHRPRWWVSRLKQCLLKAVPEPRLAPLAKRGRMLPGLDEKDYSRCAFTGADFPDVVASPDGTSGVEFPAMSEFTALAKDETPSVGFEPRRVFVRRKEKA